MCLRVTLDDETDDMAAQEAASADDEHFSKRLYILCCFRHVRWYLGAIGGVTSRGIVLPKELGGSWHPHMVRVFVVNGSGPHA